MPKKTSDHRRKAEDALAFLFALSAEILAAMTKASGELRAAPPEIRDKAEFMLRYVTLFHGGLLCFETLIKNKTEAELFDTALHDAFQKETGENPRPHIRRYLQYAEKVGDRGYVQFVGFSIAEALGKRDVMLAVEMCKIYADTIEGKLEPGLRKIVS